MLNIAILPLAVYIAAVLAIVAIFILIILISDWWAFAVLLMLIFTRLYNIRVI